jgi:hypothetical protein
MSLSEPHAPKRYIYAQIVDIAWYHGRQCIKDYKVRYPEGVARGGRTLSSIMYVPTMRYLIYILHGF